MNDKNALYVIAAPIVVILMIGVTASAKAGELSLTLPLTSYHLSSSTIPNSKRPYNDNNLGFGLGYRKQGNPNFDYGIQIGTYKNSYYRQSNYVALDVGYRFNSTIRAGLLMGAISGYGGNNWVGGYGPLIAPQLEINVTKNTATVLTFIPTTIPQGSNAIALSIKYTFN